MPFYGVKIIKMEFKKLERYLKNGYRLTQADAMELSKRENQQEVWELAGRIRKYFYDNTLDTCSIMNARSGKCSEDCKWCSQSKFHNTNAEVYPLVNKDAVMEMAQRVKDSKVRKFSLVTSGRSVEGEDLNKLCDIYKEVIDKTGLYMCASLGLLNYDQMKQLSESGVKRYHCNLETSPLNFANLCTTHTIEEKIETIRFAQSLGMEVCSGGIIGMGESMKDRIDLALTLRELGVKSMPINVLNPIKGTPLEGTEPMSAEELLTSFALFKLINPEARVRFAGGRVLFAEVQEKALQYGVDAAMIGDLLTTVGADSNTDKQMFERLGLEINFED